MPKMSAASADTHDVDSLAVYLFIMNEVKAGRTVRAARAVAKTHFSLASDGVVRGLCERTGDRCLARALCRPDEEAKEG